VRDEKLEKSLNELAEAATQPVHPHLAADIKHQIPQQLSPHRGGMDAVNIIIDLRIGKLAAAVAIIVTMILFANLLRSRSPEGVGIVQDCKLLIRYCLGDIYTRRSNVLAAKSGYEHLAQRVEDVVYYGDSIDTVDSNTVLIQWRLPDGQYKVVFGDLREKTVTAEELIKLQARMLQEKAK